MAGSLKDVFSYGSLIHAIAGAVGGATAITLFFPLNSIRLRMQVDDSTKGKSIMEVAKLMAEDGYERAFYRGLKAQIVCLAASNFIYFYSYNSLKVVLGVKKDISPVANLFVASVAGVINVLATSPLWTICVQVMSMSRKGKEPGIIEHGTKLVNRDGFWSLWNGVIPSLWLVSNPSVQFVVYERLRIMFSRMAERRGSPISAIEFFIIGALAKAAATYVTYPLQIAQSKLRTDKKAKEKGGKFQYTGTLDCLQKVVAKNGPLGLYQGINAKLLQTVLTAAFQFLTYEQIQLAVFRSFGLHAPQKVAMSSFVEKKKVAA